MCSAVNDACKLALFTRVIYIFPIHTHHIRRIDVRTVVAQFGDSFGEAVAGGQV
jgi:hypothetical protein